MKTLITIALSLLSFNLMAQESEALLLERCFKKVKHHYHKFGPPSDKTKTITKQKLLLKGDVLRGFQNQVLASFDQDVLVYMGSGSYYSGFFQDFIVADPSDCKVLEIINIYSE